MPFSPEDRLSHVRAAFAGKYEILDILGQGGSATVYLARDARHSRTVAIKVLDSALTDAVGGKRFLREIETAAGLVHPHILTVHDSGEADGLLYYVMPHVAGQSLRDRIRKSGSLKPIEALQIAGDVADALAYAHARGVIHRDIKPGNILVAEDGRAWVADFGVARALMSTDRSVTSSGLFVGTPLYMSPEQAAADSSIDGKSDLYSLGCVLYEMLTGKPPFQGSVHVALAAKLHGIGTPDPIDSAVPAEVASIIRKVLNPDPNERHENAAIFGRALTEAAAALDGQRSKSRRRSLQWSGRHPWLRSRWFALAASLAAAVLLIRAWTVWGSSRAPLVNPDRYVVVPFANAAGLSVPLGLEDALIREIEKWRDLEVVDASPLLDVGPDAPLSTQDARRFAVDSGAGLFITGEYSGPASRPRVRVFLHAVSSNAPIDEASAALAPYRADAIVELVEQLLFPEKRVLQQALPTSDVGTAYAAAWRAYISGLAETEKLDLVQADSAFRRAVATDPDFAHAHFWLSQVALWLWQPLTVVEAAAARALRSVDRLPPRDQILARAAWHMGRAEFPEACIRYDSLTTRYPYDFAPWYGLGECTRRDSVVVRDPDRSPSGWSFRSSWHRSVSAYRQAFLLLRTPARSDTVQRRVLSGFRENDFGRVREVLFTGSGRFRPGHSLPNKEPFYAGASWQGDTLAFMPYPAEDVFAGRRWTVSASEFAAIENQRRVFRNIAAAWSQAFPDNLDALEAVAVSLELLGDGNAVDTIAAARQFAVDATDRYRLAAREALLRFKFSVPDRVDGLERAVELADSLLNADDPPPALAGSTWALASLVGRADVAARAARSSANQLTGVPVGHRSEAAALIAYAALGEPVDSIQAVERRLEQAIRGAGSPESIDSVRYLALGQAAALAFPSHTFELLRDGLLFDDYQLTLGAALLRSDTVFIRDELQRIREARRSLRPADLTLDALFVEAWILTRIGAVQDAIDWLDPTLEAFRYQQLWEVWDAPIQLSSVMRAIQLRAELARTVGDTNTAERWSRAHRLVR